MRVVIIEDEAPAFRRLQKILEELTPNVQIVEVFDSVEASVDWFNNGAAHLADLAFMDIQLSDGLSFEVFEKSRVNLPVIFTTAFDEYLLNAFKVNGIDYLLKPIKPEELSKSLEKLEHIRKIFSTENTTDLKNLLSKINLNEKQFKTRFLARQGAKLVSVPVENIAFFHIKGGVVFLHTTQEEKMIMDLSIDEIGKQVDPQKFYRANRQYLVHYPVIGAVERYFKGKLLVRTKVPAPEPITISEEKATDFKTWLDQ